MVRHHASTAAAKTPKNLTANLSRGSLNLLVLHAHHTLIKEGCQFQDPPGPYCCELMINAP